MRQCTAIEVRSPQGDLRGWALFINRVWVGFVPLLEAEGR